MKTVSKYPFKIDLGHVEMPKGAKILKAECYGYNNYWLWALVDPAALTVKRAIRVYSTGQEIPDEDVGVYINTINDSPYVWHVFDRGEIISVKKL